MTRRHWGCLAAGLLAACQLAPAAPGGPPPNQTVLPSTPLTYPTLPPEWTATFTPTAGPPTATPAPSRTPTATPVGPYSQRLAAAQPAIAQALKRFNSGQYAQALDQWNQIIAQVPEYADAYYQRARCLLHLAPDIRVETDFRAMQEQALADMDTALSLDPSNGNYYHERQFIYVNLGTLELYRADQDYWAALALADAQAALRFATTIPYADRDAADRQIDAGHPEVAVDLYTRLPPVPGRTLVSDADLQDGLARALFGQGFLDQALAHINLSQRLSASNDKLSFKALILLSQGQPAAALTALKQVTVAGRLCGCDYYLRALVYYQLGQPALAQADIDTGTPQTWARGGLRSYVLGLLALDQGDTATGQQLLQEAQASLPRSDGPALLKQITQKLDSLGVPRLNPTPYAGALETPMPTPP